ncbi:hypothetical protein D3C85_1579130 [compost metagenome]
MGVEATDGKAGRAHHLIDARLGRTVLDQRTAGRIKNPFAGFRLFVVHACLQILWLEYYSHNIFGKQKMLPLVASGKEGMGKVFFETKTKGSFNNRMSLEIPQSG